MATLAPQAGRAPAVSLPIWQSRAVIASVLAAALGYLGFSLWSGWTNVAQAIARVGPGGIGVILVLSLVNYLLRFVRWQAFLRKLQADAPLGPSLRIYFAGFALTTTPGKAGEVVRALFLRPFGIPYSSTLAAFVSERLSDLLAIVLLTLLCLSPYPAARPAIFAALAIVGLGIALLAMPTLLARVVDASKEGTRIGAILRTGAALLLDIRRCHSAGMIVLASVCSLVAWAAEAYAFALLLGWLGFSCTTAFAMFTYTVSILCGALSMAPGGLGGAEAVMIAILISAGMDHGDAVAATVAIRLCTLWFAVLLGALALTAQRTSQPRARAHG